MSFKQVILLVVMLIMSSKNISQADSIGVNIYGLSFHSGVDNYDYDLLNEVNIGSGFRANFGKKDGDAILWNVGNIMIPIIMMLDIFQLDINIVYGTNFGLE